jgi:uncharacterized protein YqjF (DUF2071 family)
VTEPEPISVTAPPLHGHSVAGQRWSTATFLHWRVASSAVQQLLPVGVSADEWDGTSWVGLIAFRLEDATLLGGPPVPYFGSFTEVNVRLYGVDEDGRRGVVFLSLEAARLAAVLAARAGFSIPYFWSATTMAQAEGLIGYASRRVVGTGSSRIVARPTDEPADDALSRFLTARWGLFTRRLGHTVFLPNAHEPWDLRRAELVSLSDTLVTRGGLAGITDRAPDSVLYSPGVTARFGRPLTRMAAQGPGD